MAGPFVRRKTGQDDVWLELPYDPNNIGKNFFLSPYGKGLGSIL